MAQQMLSGTLYFREDGDKPGWRRCSLCPPEYNTSRRTDNFRTHVLQHHYDYFDSMNATGNLLGMFNTGRALGNIQGEYLMTRAFRMSMGFAVAPWVHPARIEHGQDVDTLLEIPWVNESPIYESEELDDSFASDGQLESSASVSFGSYSESRSDNVLSALEEDSPVTPVRLRNTEEVHLMQEDDLAELVGYAMPQEDDAEEDWLCVICLGLGGKADTRCCLSNASHKVCSACFDELQHRYAPCPFCRGPAPEWETRPLVVTPDPDLVVELNEEEEQAFARETIPSPISDDDRDDDPDFYPGLVFTTYPEIQI